MNSSKPALFGHYESILPFEMEHCPESFFFSFIATMCEDVSMRISEQGEEDYDSLSDELIINFAALAEKFYRDNESLIAEAEEEGYSEDRLASWLWLQLSGAGCGFFDESNVPSLEALDKYCEEAYPNWDGDNPPYVGDDGVLYAFGIMTRQVEMLDK